MCFWMTGVGGLQLVRFRHGVRRKRTPDSLLELAESCWFCIQHLGHMFRDVPDAEAEASVDAAWQARFDALPPSTGCATRA
jgi:hypothetical protein